MQSITSLNGDRGRLGIALKQLSPFVHRIILLTQPPQLPVSGLRASIRSGSRPPFIEDLEERTHRVELNELVKRCKDEKVSVVDVGPLFSGKNGEVRFFDGNGKQLYQDQGHLSGVGAQVVKEALLKTMKNIAQ
jgi:hypothetical protein